MSSNPDSRKSDQETNTLQLDVGQVLELLDSQATGIHEEIESVAQAYENDEELPTDTINSIRTEVMEFQATFEDYLAADCDGTEPWEHASELVPRNRLTAFRGRA